MAMVFIAAPLFGGTGPIHIARPIAKGRAPVNRNGPPSCSPFCNGTMLQFQYFGGKVIPNAKTYAVFWTSASGSVTPAQIGGFLQSLTNSTWMDWLNEYSTAGLGSPASNQNVGRGTYGGSITITPIATSTHACVSAQDAGTVCIWDTDIPTELDAQIDAGNLPPPDQHTLYTFYFPAGIGIEAFDRVSGDSCNAYCAYHFTYERPDYGSVYFAVVPDLGANGCQSGCGNGTVFQNTCSSSSHEIGEAITDAEVGIGTAVAFPLAWYDAGTNSLGEVGDMCNQFTDTFTSFGGQTYTLQTLFSHLIWNANPSQTTQACVSSRVAATDFDIFFNPNTVSVAPGNNIAIPIHVETTSGSASSVTLSVSALSTIGSGVHATTSQPSVFSVTPGGGTAANLNIAVDAGAPPERDAVVVVNASSGGIVHTAAILLQVGNATIAASNSPVCSGGTIKLATPAVVGATYSWTGPNGFTSTLQNPSIAGATALNAGTYTVTVTGGGPTLTASTVVAVSPPPLIGSYPSATFIAAGASKTFFPAMPPAGASLVATASAGFTGTIAVDSVTGIVTVGNAGPANTAITITVTATDVCGSNAVKTFPLLINSFSSDPLAASVTPITAAHINELRSAIKAAAALVTQVPAFTDDPLPAGAAIKAVYITELRTALTNAFTALLLPVPTFTDPTITPGVTSAKAAHVQELRNALK